MKGPLVSIIVPCYNQGAYLKETLNSVLNQTFSDWECVVMDDGSTDNSKDVAQSFCSKDDRFHYFYQENQGLAISRNNAILNSCGHFILPLDADDLIHREYVAEAVSVLQSRKEVKVVCCRAEYFGEKTGEWMLPKFSMLGLLFQNCIFCTAMFRREDYNQTKGYNPNMKYGYEDWDFWLSLLENGGEVYQLQKVYFYYRIKKESMLIDLRKRKERGFEMATKVLNNHPALYRRYYTDLYCKYIEIVNSRLFVAFDFIRKIRRLFR